MNNALPDHRRAIHGRTHSRTWRHADYDPIEHHTAPISERISGALFATFLGVVGAALLFHWLSS